MALMKMREICSKIGSGATPKGGKEAYIDSGISLVRSQNVLDFAFSYEGLAHINEQQAEKLNNVIVESGDVLLNITGDSVARACIIEDAVLPARVNQHVAIVRANKEIAVGSYLLYFLQMSKPYLLRLAAGGATRNALTKAMIEDLEIEIPPLEEQRRIVSVIDDIQEKIRVNEEINDNLAEQAEAIFEKYYCASTNQQSFTSLINVLGGGTPKTGNPDFWNGSIPFFTPKDVGAPYTFQTEKYITETGLDHCNSRLYPKNTTFVTARGTVGKVGLAGIPMAMNQSCYALSSDTIDPILVYFYVLKAVASLKHKASGAVFDAIVTRDFDSEIINVLSSEYSQTVVSVITPMMESIHNNAEENMRLSALRDALLPKLMTGELDVSNIDI